MANSSIIGNAKNLIVKELIKDEEIIKGINSTDTDNESPEELIGTHIFDYNQNPNTINTVQTFITIQVQIPQMYPYTEKVWLNPTIIIWIISHERHMKVDNIPKVKENRNDYLSKLIDKKFNNCDGFGYGKLNLITNEEGAFQQDYVYRKMTFQAVDLNNSLCDDEEWN